jgi:anti-sigma regulatory factor (Ser/Thr protein kinase)
VNVVWQDYPVYSRCLNDATTTADAVRDVVERTHRRLLTADGSVATSHRYQEALDFEGVPPADDPLEGTRPGVTLVDAPLKQIRRRIAGAARGRIDETAFDELLFALSEAVINAQLYGRPPVTVHAWTGTDRVLVHVRDAGPGPTDPLVGLLPAPDGTAGAGLGLWLAHQLPTVDIALLTEADGFTVRLGSGRPPRPDDDPAGRDRPGR